MVVRGTASARFRQALRRATTEFGAGHAEIFAQEIIHRQVVAHVARAVHAAIDAAISDTQLWYCLLDTLPIAPMRTRCPRLELPTDRSVLSLCPMAWTEARDA